MPVNNDTYRNARYTKGNALVSVDGAPPDPEPFGARSSAVISATVTGTMGTTGPIALAGTSGAVAQVLAVVGTVYDQDPDLYLDSVAASGLTDRLAQVDAQYAPRVESRWRNQTSIEHRNFTAAARFVPPGGQTTLTAFYTYRKAVPIEHLSYTDITSGTASPDHHRVISPSINNKDVRMDRLNAANGTQQTFKAQTLRFNGSQFSETAVGTNRRWVTRYNFSYTEGPPVGTTTDPTKWVQYTYNVTEKSGWNEFVGTWSAGAEVQLYGTADFNAAFDFVDNA